MGVELSELERTDSEMLDWGEMHIRRDEIIIRAAKAGHTVSHISHLMEISRSPIIGVLQANNLTHLIRARGNPGGKRRRP